MKIAFIGQKGFPASWGGVEVHVDEVARRLARRGHDVIVFNRAWYAPRVEDGAVCDDVRVVNAATVKARKLDAIVHSFTSTLSALTERAHILHYQCMGPSLVCPLARLARKRVVATIHGYDYRAAKWGALARTALKSGEWLALRVPQRTIVVAAHMRDHYRALGFETVFIPNGVTTCSPPDAKRIREQWNLHPKGYLLFLGRLEANKRPDLLIDAFRRAESAGVTRGIKLVIAGGANWPDAYVRNLQNHASDSIVFVQDVVGREKAELLAHALGFVTPSEFEGMPIALLEAMAAGQPVVASDIPAHRELLASDTGILCDCSSVAGLESGLQKLLRLSDLERSELGSRAASAARGYSWDATVDQLESVYRTVQGRP